MATIKILYFTAGMVPTTEERAEIDALNGLLTPVYEVGVRNALVSTAFGAGIEHADYVAGTIPTAYNDPEDYPVFDPEEVPTSVTNGQAIDVDNSAGSATAVGAVVVTVGVPSVDLPATIALVADAGTVSVEPSGSFVDTVTFTVADGVITAIVLS